MAARRFQISLEKFPVSAVLYPNYYPTACTSRTGDYWSVVFVRTSGFYSPVRLSRSEGNMEFENHRDGNENVAKLNVIVLSLEIWRRLYFEAYTFGFGNGEV